MDKFACEDYKVMNETELGDIAGGGNGLLGSGYGINLEIQLLVLEKDFLMLLGNSI